MARPHRRDKGDREGASSGGLAAHQLEAVAKPHLPLKQLAGEEAAAGDRGNFKDLESLLDQLGSPPVFELGKPLPNEEYMPKSRAGDCPAAHNRALLDQ